MEIDPFETLFNADISESQNSTSDEPLPAGDHILNINYHKIERKGWAESEGNPTGTVVVVGFGKPGHGLTFENFSVDPEKWGWKIKQLYEAAGLEWGQPVKELVGRQIAGTITVSDKGYRNCRNYKSLDAVAKAPPKSKAVKQTKTQQVDAENGADLNSLPF